MDRYKNALASACKCMAEARNELFIALVNVAMNNEHSELDETFKTGEIFNFEKDHFRDCEDLNLAKLYKLVDKIDEVYSSVVNLNGLEGTLSDED